MEMRVDSRLIRAEREKRAWSQEHLARLAGLGLRTIQRIEASGLASYESVSAISSVLQIPVSVLRIESPRRRALSGRVPRKAVAVAALLFGIGVSAFLTRAVMAQQIMLDVGIAVDGQAAGTDSSRVSVGEGKDAEILIEDVLRLVVVPTIREDGSILLSTEVHMLDGNVYDLVSKPKVATRSGLPAAIELGTASGKLVSISITARPD